MTLPFKKAPIFLFVFSVILLIIGGKLVQEKPEVANKPLYESNALIAEAYKNRRSNIEVSGSGKIVKILQDDLKGSKHQRLIVALEEGHTILLSHNIDIAPRIKHPRQGEKIAFQGEYEWNENGGVVHWTHRDPKGRHKGGWVRYQEKLYH